MRSVSELAVHDFWGGDDTSPIELGPAANYWRKLVPEDWPFLTCQRANRLHEVHITIFWLGTVTNIFILEL